MEPVLRSDRRCHHPKVLLKQYEMEVQGVLAFVVEEGHGWKHMVHLKHGCWDCSRWSWVVRTLLLKLCGTGNFWS